MFTQFEGFSGSNAAVVHNSKSHFNNFANSTPTISEQILKIPLGEPFVLKKVGDIYFISTIDLAVSGGDNNSQSSEWLPDIYYKDATLARQYLRSLVFGFSYLTGLGKIIHPHTTAEAVFCLIVMIYGKFCIAFLVGSVARIMTNMHEIRTKYATSSHKINQYLKDIKVPNELLNRYLLLLYFLSILEPMTIWSMFGLSSKALNQMRL